MFYDRLNELCKADGLTITKFALTELGVSNSTPTAWRKGTPPNSSVIIKAAKYFNVSADYLLGLSDIMRPLEGLDADDVAILRIWQSADPLLRDAALRVLQPSTDTIGGSLSPSRENDIPDAL